MFVCWCLGCVGHPCAPNMLAVWWLVLAVHLCICMGPAPFWCPCVPLLDDFGWCDPAFFIYVMVIMLTL